MTLDFRPHRQAGATPWRVAAAVNFALVHGRPPSDEELSNASEQVDIGGRTVTTWARWAAAAMICPYTTDDDLRSSYCGAAKCRHWVDDGSMTGHGTCARAER